MQVGPFNATKFVLIAELFQFEQLIILLEGIYPRDYPRYSDFTEKGSNPRPFQENAEAAGIRFSKADAGSFRAEETSHALQYRCTRQHSPPHDTRAYHRHCKRWPLFWSNEMTAIRTLSIAALALSAMAAQAQTNANDQATANAAPLTREAVIAELVASRAAGNTTPRDGEWYNVPAPLAIGSSNSQPAPTTK